MHLQTDPRSPTSPTSPDPQTNPEPTPKPTTSGTSTSTSTDTGTGTGTGNITTKHLYFAYGSNLSPTQMSTRCKTPSSSIPLATAYLPNWSWLICEAGYANVIPPSEQRVGKQRNAATPTPILALAPASASSSKGGSQENNDNDNGKAEDEEEEEQGGVWGVLYDMTPSDEKILDGYEGVDTRAPISARNDDVFKSDVYRPQEQGVGAYNKWIVWARVEKWLVEKKNEVVSSSGVPVKQVLKPRQVKLEEEEDGEGEREEEWIQVLVYVDEKRVAAGPPRDEYIPRMNRAMRECAGLGVDGGWIERVVRGFIPDV